MNTVQFLAAVLPPRGPYRLEYKKNIHKTAWANTVEELAQLATEQDATGANVWFRTASFNNRVNGRKVNAAFKSCYQIDIDIGKGERLGYETRREGAAALVDLVTKNNLPAPIIVDSGHGYHVYWALKEPVTVDVWNVTRSSLVDLLAANEFRCDVGKTKDLVCLLRIPGTHNRKENPLPVRVLKSARPTTQEIFAKALGVSPIEGDESLGALFAPDDSLQTKPDYRPSDAEGVATNCAFVRRFKNDGMYDAAGGMQEQWYNAINAIHLCVNGHEKAHEYSAAAGEGYDANAVDKKLAQLTENDIGPMTCEAIKVHGYCDGCPHVGKITVPMQLGVEEAEQAELEQTVEESAGGPWWPFGCGWDDTKKQMYIDKWNPEEGVMQPEFFSTTKFYVETRIFDEDAWAFLVWRLKYTRSEGREVWESFTVPTGHIARTTELATEFAKQEVYVAKRTGANDLAEVLKKYGDALRSMEIEAVMHSVMGWYVSDTDTPKTDVSYAPQADGFIIGNKMITATETQAVLLNDHIQNDWRHGFGQAGDVQTWARTVHKLFVVKKNIVAQFMILVDLASVTVPLFGRSEYHGSLITLVGGPGVGKSASCKVGLTVWGNPDMLTLNGNPSVGITPKAFQKMLSTLRNIGPLMDEVGKQHANILGELAHITALGKPRPRLTIEGKPQKVDDPWFSNTKMTSNKPVLNIVAEDENDTEDAADAIQNRIFEINYVRLGLDKEKENYDPAMGTDIQTLIDTQYGTAGPVWVRFIMGHMDHVIDVLDKSHREVKLRSPDHAKERFLDYLEAGVLATGKLVEESGLMFPDMAGIRQLITDVREDMTSVRQDSKVPMVDAFARYLAQNAGGLMRTKHFVVGKGNKAPDEFPMNEMRGELVGRVAMNDQFAALAVGPMKEWCKNRSLDFTRMVAELDKYSYFVHEPALLAQNKNKQDPIKTAVMRLNLGRGVPVTSSRQQCFVMDFGRVAGKAKLRPVSDSDSAADAQ